jgi:hypothetical protein
MSRPKRTYTLTIDRLTADDMDSLTRESDRSGHDVVSIVRALIRSSRYAQVSVDSGTSGVPNGKGSALSGPDLTDKPTKSADFSFSVPQMKAMASAESTDELRSLSKMSPDALKQRAGDIAKRAGLADTSPYGDRGMDGQNALLIERLETIRERRADGAV